MILKWVWINLYYFLLNIEEKQNEVLKIKMLHELIWMS